MLPCTKYLTKNQMKHTNFFNDEKIYFHRLDNYHTSFSLQGY